MTGIFQGSDLNKIVSGMFSHTKNQIENPALANSRFILDEVLFMNISFYQLNLTRGSSYLPLPDWISRKGGVINPKNEINKECFKWSIIAALHNGEIRSHPERISNLVRLEDNYDFSELEFSLSINRISKFETKTTSSLTY